MTATAGASAQAQNVQITIGGAQIHLRQVKLSEALYIDEVHLDGTELVYETHAGAASGEPTSKISVEETKFTAMMSEPNLNLLLASRLAPDAPVRGVKLALLSGKARLTGHVVKSVLSLPFTVEGVPILDNGTRVRLDFQAARIGIAIPGLVLDAIEQHVNHILTLDLSRLSFPVRLDEIKCEPGRLTVRGKARILWPPVTVTPPPPPFSALGKPLPQETPAELPAGELP